MRLAEIAKRFLKDLGISATKTIPIDDVASVIRLFQPLESKIPLLRVGGPGDGGYLLPDDLDGIKAVFSPGVAETATFESWFAERGVPSYLIDGSLAKPPVDDPLLKFESLWLASETQLGYSVSLTDWIEQNCPGTSDLILQIDIEGAEYESLLSTSSETLSAFRIIVIELHELHTITSKMGNRMVRLLMRHLLHSHDLVHTHVNNFEAGLKLGNLRIPEVIELTFHRKDRSSLTGQIALLPHALDEPNTQQPDWTIKF